MYESTREKTNKILILRWNREMGSISVEQMMEKQRAKGPATILAIGTATPPNSYLQADYPDFYFRVTNSEHKTQLKEKFKRICKYRFA